MSPWKMFPPVRPRTRSMSVGVTTSQCVAPRGAGGADASVVSRTISAALGRYSSHVVPRNSVGAYWTKHVIVCFPGGATLGSRTLWYWVSMNGWLEKAPYFASSYARSTYSMEGVMSIVPLWWGPGAPGIAVYSGRPSRAALNLRAAP